MEQLTEQQVDMYLTQTPNYDMTSFAGRKEIALKNYREPKILALRNKLVQELETETINSYKHQIENRIKMVDLMALNNIDFDTIEYHSYSLISDEELSEYAQFKVKVVIYDPINLKRSAEGHAYRKSKEFTSKFILN